MQAEADVLLTTADCELTKGGGLASQAALKRR